MSRKKISATLAGYYYRDRNVCWLTRKVNVTERATIPKDLLYYCTACQPKLSSSPYFPMAVQEESHDPQNDRRLSPRAIVVGSVYIGTFS